MGRSKDYISKLRGLASKGFDPRQAALGNPDLQELALREAMAKRRADIRKVAGARSKERRIKIAAQRLARDRARKLKKKFLTKRSWAIPARMLFGRRISSPILDRLDPQRATRWKPIVSRRFKREPPRVQLGSLNFLDDPVGTMSEFAKISRAECDEVRSFLDFADAHCVDVGAYLVLAEIWPQLAKIFQGGRMSRPVQKVLSAIRLDQELDIGLQGVRDHEDVWAFPTRHRRPRGTTTSASANLQPQEREKVADDLCDLIDEWLHVADDERGNEDLDRWELSPEGRSLIARMSGELLDNAERHSFPGSTDGDWSMTAFMAARPSAEGKRELRCYMAFLSVGQSMAESMSGAPTELLNAAERYLGQFGGDGPSRETLMTIVALQDAVTSDPDATRSGRGGTGLQDVLELVADLGATDRPDADVRVTIVSGKSCIRLRHPHLLGQRDARGRRVQWCNPWNDPRRPPHVKTAFDLPAHFAGTLVSAGFTLDSRLFADEATEIDDLGN